MATGGSEAGGGLGPPGAPDLPPIPDDARELSLDVRAYRREQRARRWQRAWSQVGRLASGGRYGPALPLVIGVLVVCIAVSALMIAAAQRPPPAAPQQPLASTSVAPGHVGGLLPDVPLRAGHDTVPARSLRPTVLAVLPSGACDCATLLDDLAAKVSQFGVRLVAVADAADEAALDRLASTVRRGQVLPAVDAGHALWSGLDGAGVTVAVVAADGVITALHRNATSDVPLDVELSRTLR